MSEISDDRLREIAGVYCLECADEPSVEPTCEHALAREARRQREEVARLETVLRESDDHIMWAWCLIANASGGAWEEESEEWRKGATKWRDEVLGPPSPRAALAEARVSALEAALRRMHEELCCDQGPLCSGYTDFAPAEELNRDGQVLFDEVIAEQARAEAAEARSAELERLLREIVAARSLIVIGNAEKHPYASARFDLLMVEADAALAASREEER